jgi:hypothetical protein
MRYTRTLQVRRQGSTSAGIEGAKYMQAPGQLRRKPLAGRPHVLFCENFSMVLSNSTILYTMMNRESLTRSVSFDLYDYWREQGFF